METAKVKKVSPFSATQIGAIENVGNRHLIRSQFKEEARVVNEELKKIHHCRKIAHMQTNYPNAIMTLSQGRQDLPAIQQRSDDVRAQAPKFTARQSEFLSGMNTNIHHEHEFNHKKRAYNREVGRKATIDGILKGSAPIGKNILFPNKATHTQCLHLSGAICMPNPHTVPPEVPRGRKWLGDDVGWQA